MVGYLLYIQEPEPEREYKWQEEKKEDEQAESSGYEAGPNLHTEKEPNIKEYINRTKQKQKQDYEELAEGNI